MKRGKGNVPEFAKFMNKKNNKANERAEKSSESEASRFDNNSAKGQSMKNSNASHRTCQ